MSSTASAGKDWSIRGSLKEDILRVLHRRGRPMNYRQIHSKLLILNRKDGLDAVRRDISSLKKGGFLEKRAFTSIAEADRALDKLSRFFRRVERCPASAYPAVTSYCLTASGRLISEAASHITQAKRHRIPNAVSRLHDEYLDRLYRFLVRKSVRDSMVNAREAKHADSLPW